MSYALLECIDVDTAKNLCTFLRNASRRAGVEFSPNFFGRMVGASYQGDFNFVYPFFMELVTYYPRKIAFIGINDRGTYPDDDYKLVLLEDMPVYATLRNATEKKYWGTLKKDFLKAVNKSGVTYEEFLTIIERCAIGQVSNRDIDICAMDFKTLANGNQRMMNLEALLDSGRLYDSMSYGFYTQMRAMAHVCYLRLRKFRR